MFDEIYIYPAAGDDGVSIGAALASYYLKGRKKVFLKTNQSPYLGYKATNKEILDAIKKNKLKYKKSKNIYKDTTILLTPEQVKNCLFLIQN